MCSGLVIGTSSTANVDTIKNERTTWSKKNVVRYEACWHGNDEGSTTIRRRVKEWLVRYEVLEVMNVDILVDRHPPQ
jgi:hypothetical protein